MREKENQNPRKEHLPRSSDIAANRRSKNSPAKKTSNKIAQKSLIEAFVSPAIEDVSTEISEDSIDFSSISAISDGNCNGERAESFVMGTYSSLSTSSETFARSELTPCSKISTAKGDEQIDFSKTGAAAEVEIVVNLLKQARLQALNSVDMDYQSRKVLNALIELIINDFYTLPQEKDELPELVTRNAYLIFLCLLVLLFSFCFFSYSRATCSYTGPPPT